MLPDHYATLGVAPNCSRAAIRAAYVELMRRYHPDRNPSVAAAARVRAITAAYAIIGVPHRRDDYDLERARLRAAHASACTFERPRERLTPSIAVLFGIAAIALLVPTLISPPLIPPERSGRIHGVGGKEAAAPQKLVQAAVEEEQAAGWAASMPGVRCTSPAAAGLIKRELFRRAVQLRGSDWAAFKKLADYSLVRFESPVLTGENQESGTINCKASVAVDLPAGVVLPGARRTLAADIAYSFRAADGITDMISLSDEGPIVTPLAGVAQMPRQATSQLNAPTAPENGARNKRAKVVEQKSSAAQAPEAAVARAQAIQPRPEPPQPRPAAPAQRAPPPAGAGQAPAWQQPIKPAWQRPLPPAND